MNGTDGVRSPWPITELELNHSTRSESSVSSSACTDVKSTRAAASAWQSVNGWWNSTAAASGWSSLRPVEDQPSASPSPPEPDSSEQSNQSSARPQPRTVLPVDDNPTDVFVIREV